MSNKSKYENQSVSPIQKLSGTILKYTQGVPSTDTDNLNYYKNFIYICMTPLGTIRPRRGTCIRKITVNTMPTINALLLILFLFNVVILLRLKQHYCRILTIEYNIRHAYTLMAKDVIRRIRIIDTTQGNCIMSSYCRRAS